MAQLPARQTSSAIDLAEVLTDLQITKFSTLPHVFDQSFLYRIFCGLYNLLASFSRAFANLILCWGLGGGDNSEDPATPSTRLGL